MTGNRDTQRIIDLTMTIDQDLPDATVHPNRSIAEDGWRATTLELYSHCGTHMDATCHFLPDGETIDQLNLQACFGPARLVDLTPTQPKQWITVDDFETAIDGSLVSGERLLLRTDWYKRFPDPSYRHELPRISDELAAYFVDHEVRLLGVEPPSIADVNNIEEVTRIHQTLFRGGIVIVEGLTNLDKIDTNEFCFVAFPLKVAGGDGCPVRAVAVTGPIARTANEETRPETQFGFSRST